MRPMLWVNTAKTVYVEQVSVTISMACIRFYPAVMGSEVNIHLLSSCIFTAFQEENLLKKERKQERWFPHRLAQNGANCKVENGYTCGATTSPCESHEGNL